MITEFKLFESNDNPIEYSVGDIVIWSTKNDKYHNYLSNVNQYTGKIESGEYGKEYEVLQIFYYGSSYKQVRKNELYLYFANIKDIESGEIINTISTHYLTLKSKFVFPDEPQIGDYVICDMNTPVFDNSDKNIKEFLSSKIGRIIRYDFNKGDGKYIVEWRNVPWDLQYFFWNTTNPHIKDLGCLNVKMDQIVYYHKDIKNVEGYIKAKKYNI